MATMRAVQADALRRLMVLRDIAVPEIGEQDALVRVFASGICRTDWHVWNGDWTWAGLDLPLPITLGHEIGGVVERVGSQVSNLKPGMRVCVPFNFADGTCPYCKRGKQNLCENAAWNFTTPGSGGFAEFARVPNAQLNCIPLPENVTERDLEKLADDPFVRSTTWVYANEYDPAKVYHGGKPGGTRVITVELSALQGGFDVATKAELIKRVTDAVAKAAGLAGDILPVYVLLHDVPPQSWGFSGKPLSFEQLQSPPAGAKPL